MRIQFIQRYFADTKVGAKLTLDAGDAKKSMKEFKKEVKDARTDLLNMQATFGATSKEALDAAKRVAELEDNLKDASETVKLFDPGNKFQVLGNAVRGLVGGFTALQGAMALVGVEGEEVQKTLLKVQGALALTEGLNVVADMAKDFQRLGSVLMQTLGKGGMMGIAIAGVTALGLAFAGVFNDKRTKDVIALKDSLQDYTKAANDAKLKTIEVRIAFDQAKAGVISKDQALKIYNDTLGDSLGTTKDLAVAEKNLADKADAYIKITGLKAQANALFAKSAQLSSQALIDQQELAKAEFNIAGGDIGKSIIGKQLEADLLAANEIDKLAEGLLVKAGEISKQFNVNTGPSTGKATTPKGKQAEKEVEEVSGYQKLLNDIANEQAKKEAEVRKVNNDMIVKLDQEKIDAQVAGLKQYTASEQEQAEARLRIAEWEAEGRIEAAKSVGNALGALSDLIGKETAAGKALAIAQATINTWVGVTEVLKQKSTLPEPFATISKIANVATVIASGLNAVKNISKTKVPGGGGGGGANIGGSSPAPIQPRVPAATSTTLDQQQLNQIGNATVRAFVVESDMTNNQERIRRLNRAARI